MKEAVSWHASRAGAKLRAQGSVASSIVMSVRTNPYRQQDEQYGRSVMVSFSDPTSDTSEFISAAIHGLSQIWKPGLNYKKCGVVLMGISPEQQVQFNLFSPERSVRSWDLMKTLDRVNARHGKRSLCFGAVGVNQKWGMKREASSPSYTTKWGEVLSV